MLIFLVSCRGRNLLWKLIDPSRQEHLSGVISMVLHMALPTECHRNEVRNIVNIIYFLWKWHGFSNYKSTVTNIWEGDGTPLQYSCLENPMDRGAWWAAVHGVVNSPTQLSDFTFTFHFPALEKERQPTPVFLPGESQGRGSLVSCRLWGRTVRHDWSDLAAAAAVTNITQRNSLR